MSVTALDLPPDLHHPGEAILQERWGDYRGALRQIGFRLRELGVTDPGRWTRQGQVGRCDDERAVLSWMFQYQPMHLSTTIAVNDWFLERVGLRGRALRVLSLGSGPATEALALHVALQAREVDFLGVDYNPNMLGLGRQVLQQVKALRPAGAIEAKLVQTTDHPAVVGHLRVGARTDRPLLVSLSHILNQDSLDAATLRSWANAVANGLGDHGGWLIAQEPASCRLGDGKSGSPDVGVGERSFGGLTEKD